MYENCELISSKKDIYAHKHTEICIQFQEVHDPLEAPYKEHLTGSNLQCKKNPKPCKNNAHLYNLGLVFISISE